MNFLDRFGTSGLSVPTCQTLLSAAPPIRTVGFVGTVIRKALASCSWRLRTVGLPANRGNQALTRSGFGCELFALPVRLASTPLVGSWKSHAARSTAGLPPLRRKESPAWSTAPGDRIGFEWQSLPGW